MLETLYLISAIVGGTILACQFVLTLMGLGDDGMDVGDVGDGGDFGGMADVGDIGDVGDVDVGDFDDAGHHHTSWSDAADGDVSHPDSTWIFGVISFRTIVAALTFFGLVGLTTRSAGMPPAVSVVLATIAGIAAMFGVYYMMRSLMKLNASGNENITNAIGAHATVYIPIPASRGGAGKVQLSMQNRIVEFAAVTDDDEPLRTGEAVEVVAVNGSDTLEVRRIAATVAT